MGLDADGAGDPVGYDEFRGGLRELLLRADGGVMKRCVIAFALLLAGCGSTARSPQALRNQVERTEESFYGEQEGADGREEIGRAHV